MSDFINVTKIGLKSWIVDSISKNKQNIITKNNNYFVDLTNLNDYTCNCIFMQKYFKPNISKPCKHINAVKQTELRKYNKLKCNLSDKPLDYDYPIE